MIDKGIDISHLPSCYFSIGLCQRVDFTSNAGGKVGGIWAKEFLSGSEMVTQKNYISQVVRG